MNCLTFKTGTGIGHRKGPHGLQTALTAADTAVDSSLSLCTTLSHS